MRRPAVGAQWAKPIREDLAHLSKVEIHVPTIDSLSEICAWLGTFRERLRLARDDERAYAAAMVQQLEAAYQKRRAELA